MFYRFMNDGNIKWRKLLSASDRIWELILDTILEIAEMISADASELLSAVIDANPKFHKLYQMYKLVA